MVANDGNFGRLISASVITSGTQTYSVAAGTVLAGGLNLQGWPQCLTATMNLVGVGAGTRGASYRIEGVNQFGEPVMETLDFAARAGTGPAPGTSFYRMFSRYAYRYVTSVTKLTTYNSGNLSGSDTFSLGWTLETILDGGLGATTTSILTNLTDGSNSAKQRYAFALPIPVSTGTNAAGAASTGFQTEITGTVASLNLSNELDRGAGFFVDTAYSVFIPSDAQVPIAGPGAGARPYLYSIHVQSNRGES
jgi:hypothetical protein